MGDEDLPQAPRAEPADSPKDQPLSRGADKERQPAAGAACRKQPHHVSHLHLDAQAHRLTRSEFTNVRVIILRAARYD